MHIMNVSVAIAENEIQTIRQSHCDLSINKYGAGLFNCMFPPLEYVCSAVKINIYGHFASLNTIWLGA